MRPSTLVKTIGVLGVKAGESCAADPLTTAKQESATLGKSSLDIRFLIPIPPAANTIRLCRPGRKAEIRRGRTKIPALEYCGEYSPCPNGGQALPELTKRVVRFQLAGSLLAVAFAFVRMALTRASACA